MPESGTYGSVRGALSNGRPCRDYTRQHAWSLPSAEVMPGRNEGQLMREIAQGRTGQTFNNGLTVMALLQRLPRSSTLAMPRRASRVQS
jgi:hypothetical protein